MAVTQGHTLHFKLGPVQVFVAQARRTRDLWAGSFLLSWLVGHAMAEVLEGGGRIVFPWVGEEAGNELLQAIMARRAKRPPPVEPWLGTLPHRFQAVVPEAFDPARCVRAAQEAWAQCCEAVWDRYVAPVAPLGRGTPAIWDRQVAGMWEIQWVRHEDPSMLEARKLWRARPYQAEEGDKCSLMDHLQELSGWTAVRPGEAQRQAAFWQALRDVVGPLDLRDGERLSAPALVKRLFPRVADRAVGWGVPTQFPSTLHIAATSWLAAAVRDPTARAVLHAHAPAEDRAAAGDPRRQWPARLRQELEAAGAAGEAAARWDPAWWGISSGAVAPDPMAPQAVPDLHAVRQALPDELSRGPSDYFALVLMDGDHLRALLAAFGPEVISRALAGFTAQVRSLVEAAYGTVVYAGGDDVLALCPVASALDLAIRLRTAYLEAFRDRAGGAAAGASISGAVVLARTQAPLRGVVRQAHQWLDAVAKDGVGRNAVAIGVWDSTGPGTPWAAPWDTIIRSRLVDWVQQAGSRRQAGAGSSQPGPAPAGAAEALPSTRFWYAVARWWSRLGLEDAAQVSEVGPIFRRLVERQYARAAKSAGTPWSPERLGALVDLVLAEPGDPAARWGGWASLVPVLRRLTEEGGSGGGGRTAVDL